MEAIPNSLEHQKALLRQVPKEVHYSAVLASFVGVLILARFIVNGCAENTTMSKALLYGLLISGLLFLNGFFLIGKSRSGYVIVGVVAALPVLGLLAQTLHLVVLLTSGGWLQDKVGTAISSLCLVQLVATGIMFYFLLSTSVRKHVWKADIKPGAPSTETASVD
jgi:hypothetical protein